MFREVGGRGVCSMLMWITMSLRNIIKNGRRSLVTILAIGLGFGAVNVFQGYVHSSYRGLVKAVIHNEGLGHLTVFKKGFLEKGMLHPEQYQFSKNEVEKISGILRRWPGVELSTPRLSVTGILSNGRNSTIFIAQGLVPSDDQVIRGDLRVSNAFVGSYITDQIRPGVVLGSDLAAMLNLELGDDAVIMSNTYTGMANALDVKVLGIYNTGAAPTNDKTVLMTLRHAQALMDYQGAERLVVLFKRDEDSASSSAIAEKMQKTLRAGGFEVEIKTWSELSEFYNQVKNMLDMIFYFIFSIVLIIVVMSVINTMSMSVMERTREIGTLRALGLKQNRVKLLFSIEGMLLGLLGSCLGILVFFSVYLGIKTANPTYLPPGSSTPVPLTVDLVWLLLAKNTFFMVVLSLVAAFLPSRRSAEMSIVDSLGHI